MDEGTKRRFWCDSFFDQIKFVNKPADADIFFTTVPWTRYNSSDIRPNQISYLTSVRLGMNSTQSKDRNFLRSEFCIDNKILPRPDFKNFCFSSNDFCGIPYVIPVPEGPNIGDNKTIENNTFNNKVFWCGNLTHSTRIDFLSFYKTIDDERFDVSQFTEKVYQGFKPGVYENFLDNLSSSDIVYLLRGDRSWVNTFFDVIRTGCIPVMISSMNDYGWDNIFTNINDYMLMFDLRYHSMDYIHQQVVSLLENKERVMYMKNNILKFHNMFFKHNCSSYGFSEFLLAKCVEIFKQDFNISIDDKFISPEVLKLKGLSNKL